MSPSERYARAIDEGELTRDPAQAALVRSTQLLYEELVKSRVDKGFISKWWDRWRAEPVTPIKGLYLWGGVGRGKTLVVNAFFEALPFQEKLRVHFHRFMQRVHDELKSLHNVEDPLLVVAERLAVQARVICFDEFHVSDIADAMLLGRLLQGLFDRGVSLVATSNIAPDALYEGGLQRAQFLPAIELIKRHTEVIEVGAGIDYRLRALARAQIYHHPLNAHSDEQMHRCFLALSPVNVVHGQPLTVLGRQVSTLKYGEGIAWFEFDVLCESPRSATDYVELARSYHTLLLSRVPVMNDDAADRVLRFVHLVDELYDRNVNFIVSAAADPSRLYVGTRIAEMFERTRSRLEEMQTHHYLARKHVP